MYLRIGDGHFFFILSDHIDLLEVLLRRSRRVRCSIFSALLHGTCWRNLYVVPGNGHGIG